MLFYCWLIISCYFTTVCGMAKSLCLHDLLQSAGKCFWKVSLCGYLATIYGYFPAACGRRFVEKIIWTSWTMATVCCCLLKRIRNSTTDALFLASKLHFYKTQISTWRHGRELETEHEGNSSCLFTALGSLPPGVTITGFQLTCVTDITGL